MRWTHLFILFLACNASVAPTEAAEGILGESRTAVARQAMEGRWEASVGRLTLPLRLYEDGTFALREERGSYQVQGNQLLLRLGKAEPVAYHFELLDSFLILRGGDLAQDLRFAKAAAEEEAFLGYFRWLVQLSVGSVGESSYRILTILGIVALSILFLNLLRLVSHLLIFSEFGPLRFLYQRHKTKTRTIHSVVLNLLKYIICFTALGHIFAELGINYATYFASLSVIGLAIGFGSQGLVQDIVTGFFLIFDGQFGVGDMVEISGQTGTVEELGLRTTRLRNYMGQIVVIPNRNIALVGNYSKGATKAYIDVAVADDAALPQTADLLRTIAQEVRLQFEGTILAEPKDLGTIRLRTGETFRRLEVDLWPNQHQAIIDGQLLPRIREIFEREKIGLPNNRIAVSYRLPDQEGVATWRNRLGLKSRPKAAPATTASEGGVHI
jgi:moderate conductance mechanosensitive channel